jgi:hypothetical protein
VVRRQSAALWALRCFMALFFLLCGSKPASSFDEPRRHVLIITSAGGEQEFREKFWAWSSRMYHTLTGEMRIPRANITLLTGDTPPDETLPTTKSTKAEVGKAFENLRTKVAGNDLVFVFLIGHGSFDGVDYKFNLPGPDITGSELKALLDTLSSQDVVLVCGTPCSGFLARQLSHPRRVVITATRSEFENNQTVFAEFFVEAFENLKADTDKNSQVSMLEAYLFASQQVNSWYEERKLLATEHSLLEDNHDGKGVAVPSAANGEGLFASKLVLAPALGVTSSAVAESEKTEFTRLSQEKQKIEAAIQDLRYRKSKLDEKEYGQEMEALLIRLAQTNQKIRGPEKR